MPGLMGKTHQLWVSLFPGLGLQASRNENSWLLLQYRVCLLNPYFLT
ncbi:hypothetical protein LEMLEM_LOCUS22090 [Lemmus lemmus]